MRIEINDDDVMSQTIEDLKNMGISIKDIKPNNGSKDLGYIAYVTSSWKDFYEGTGPTPAKALENAVNNVIKREFN